MIPTGRILQKASKQEHLRGNKNFTWNSDYTETAPWLH